MNVINRYPARSILSLALAGLAGVAMAAHPGHSGPPAPNASTTVSFSHNPVVLSGDSDADMAIDTLTTSSVVGTAVIDAGKVTLQMAVDGLGNPTTTGTPGFTWSAVAPSNQSPVNGAAAWLPDLDGMGFVDGTTASFRAHYVTGGGSTKADTHFSPSVDLQAIADTCQGFNIGAAMASGNGAPAPGSSGPWVFRITVENCTGVSLSGVKVQGGSNGWAPMVDHQVDTGTVAVRTNKRNQVLTWVLDLASGQEESILVAVDGGIPLSAACDSIRHLSGAWSAVYDAGAGATKSDYTGRVSVQVTCPAE